MTPAQLATLKADIAADPALAAIPIGSDGDFAIAETYNQAAAVDHYVWKTSMPTQDVHDQIDWAKFTPQEAADGTLLWLNRCMACQGKQLNLDILLRAEAINPAKANVRAGLQDALTGLPSGPNGATRAAGWAQLQVALSRKASRIEKLFAVGAGTQAAPSLMGFEGPINPVEINQARAS